MASASSAKTPAAAAAAPVAAAAAEAAVEGPEGAKLDIFKDALYNRCKEVSSADATFSQDDLIKLDVIPTGNLALLARVVQSLCDDKLFITMREASGQVCWKWRDAQEAHKYKQCSTPEEVMVYSAIDDAGGDGIWSQTIQRRLNMHDSTLKTALKPLISKKLIALFKSVEHPNKKMYIKASIRPSDRATGGPWYTDQNLDEAFIEDLQRVIFDFIKRQSTYHSTHGSGGAMAAANAPPRQQAPKKGVLKGAAPPERGKKRDASQLNETPSKVTKTVATSTATTPMLLPLPAGYTAYPTVRDIARLLSTSGITHNTILTEEDVQKLVDVLVWDNLVEPIKVAGKQGYRVARAAKQSVESWAGRDDPSGRGGGPKPYISAFTEAPCGRCPVFEICEEGGPVGPHNCQYFQQWLGLN